jgi:hypothetical protein
VYVFFDAEGRPFLLDDEVRWRVEANAFLARISVVNGKTRSPRTWRSYVYQFADWFEFCARAGLEWQLVTELDLATYRNIFCRELLARPHSALYHCDTQDGTGRFYWRPEHIRRGRHRVASLAKAAGWLLGVNPGH